MNEIHTAGNTVLYALTSFFAFLPTLVGALVILILGWVIGIILAKIIEKVLIAIGFERAVHHSGIGHFIEGTAGKWTTSKIVGQLGKWFVFLLFVQAAANLLNMPQITAIMSNIVLFIPRVIIAVALIVLGSVVAKFVSGLVQRMAAQAGAKNSSLLSTLTNYAVIGFAVVAALDQLGIATTLVNTLLIGLIGSIALAVGIAFGLGGQGVAEQITKSWYESGQSAAEKLQESKSVQPSETSRVYAANSGS
jgi:hypothetical protein